MHIFTKMNKMSIEYHKRERREGLEAIREGAIDRATQIEQNAVWTRKRSRFNAERTLYKIYRDDAIRYGATLQDLQYEGLPKTIKEKNLAYKLK